MKVLKVTKAVEFYVEMADPLYVTTDEYRRGENGGWEERMGGSWESPCDDAKLEAAFQEWTRANPTDGYVADSEPSRIFVICNRYESGYGHGFAGDGLDLSRTPHDDLECGEAYQIGYEAGQHKRRQMEEEQRQWS